jgi:hypothetical protein
MQFSKVAALELPNIAVIARSDSRQVFWMSMPGGPADAATST